MSEGNHKLQRCAKDPERIEDAAYEKLVQQLLADHRIDFVFEEAQALGPTLAEHIALEQLGLHRYADVDPPKSVWQSLGIPETRNGYFIGDLDMEKQIWPCALEQIMPAHEKREQIWLEEILKRSDFGNALMICGDHHLFSFSFRLVHNGFAVKAFSYMPTIYDGRVIWPRVQKIS